MQNEIEIKLMLTPEKVTFIQEWIKQYPCITHQQQMLGNIYFDTPERYFAKNQMGLRIRKQQDTRELTLKMKGEIVGGLHIRPEYHLLIDGEQPDFARLVTHHQLSINHSDEISSNLIEMFRTDFDRETWLIQFEKSQIEIALDRGWIKNPYGEEAICEVEIELIEGCIADLLELIQQLPAEDNIWFSSLSKAHRGYFVGQSDRIQQEIDRLLDCDWQTFSLEKRYQYQQNLADFIRLRPQDERLFQKFIALAPQFAKYSEKDLYSATYRQYNLQKLRDFYLIGM